MNLQIPQKYIHGCVALVCLGIITLATSFLIAMTVQKTIRLVTKTVENNDRIETLKSRLVQERALSHSLNTDINYYDLSLEQASRPINHLKKQFIEHLNELNIDVQLLEQPKIKNISQSLAQLELRIMVKGTPTKTVTVLEALKDKHTQIKMISLRATENKRDIETIFDLSSFGRRSDTQSPLIDEDKEKADE